MTILYFIIAFIATTVGALTGMGGGVIIKPALDALSGFDVSTISLLSSSTVFVMALVSAAKHIRQKVTIDWKMAISLAAGSLIGGNFGQQILTVIIDAFCADRQVVVVQNICLALVIVIVVLYMGKGDRRAHLGLHGITPAILTGMLLGIVSSFLGIGGGPINVALIIFVFSCDMKSSAVYSIITILFAQASKFLSILLAGSFPTHDFSMLPAMALGAVIGGWTGSQVNQKLSGRAVERAFNAVQALVLSFCLFNILRNLIL